MNSDPREPRPSGYFEHIARPKVRAVLNVLLEAPFFYKDDDPELFAFLRRNLAEFSRFYDELYGFRLVVDGRAARLYKPRWYNGALKPSQHDVFELTRRDECIAFLLVLEFYEHLLDERNVDIDDTEGLRFEFGELFAFARGRLAEVRPDEPPGDDEVRRQLRSLVPTLLRYRFLREVLPSREEREGLEPDRFLYECLPALHHYDVRVLGRSLLSEALRVDVAVGTPERAPDDAEDQERGA